MNEPLLFAALVDLTMHPEKHDQHIYLRRNECGTTMCLAGDIMVLTGHAVAWDSEGEAWVTADGEQIHLVALRELAISHADGTTLFLICQHIDELWFTAEVMTDGRIKKPEGLR